MKRLGCLKDIFDALYVRIDLTLPMAAEGGGGVTFAALPIEKAIAHAVIVHLMCERQAFAM